MKPKLANLKDHSWSWLNTPIGVVLYYVDSMTADDDASMAMTSQLILGQWVIDDGSWTDEAPAGGDA